MSVELELADPAASAAADIEALRLQRMLVSSLLATMESLANALPPSTDSLGWSGPAQKQYGHALYELGGLLRSVGARFAAARSDLDRAIARGNPLG